MLINYVFLFKKYVFIYLAAVGLNWGLPRLGSGKESSCQCRRPKRCRFIPWVGKITWRRQWQPTPVFLSGESHGQRSLAGYSPRGHKQPDTTEGQHWDCSCGTRYLVLSPGIKPRPPALGAQSLTHWAIREVPIYFLRKKNLKYLLLFHKRCKV